MCCSIKSTTFVVIFTMRIERSYHDESVLLCLLSTQAHCTDVFQQTLISFKFTTIMVIIRAEGGRIDVWPFCENKSSSSFAEGFTFAYIC